MDKIYAKKWRLFHNPAVRREIDSLSPYQDVQRIVHLIGVYEFSWDINRALEVALFHTFGSQPVSRLLSLTGEFELHGQKRYDDTALLIGYFIEYGWDSDLGHRAIERMNRTHTHYRIHNDDFLFVLWTFIDFPIQWINHYGRRRMTAKEQLAWFHFWYEIGRRMGLHDIPTSKTNLDSFADRYENQNFVYSERSNQVSNATLRIIEGWFPSFIRFTVKPVVSCLMSDRFLDAVGYGHPRRWQRCLIKGVLRAVGLFNRLFALGHYPVETIKRRQRTYVSGYLIEDLQPVHLATRRSNRGRGGHRRAT
jgi:hypothetical protein